MKESFFKEEVSQWNTDSFMFNSFLLSFSTPYASLTVYDPVHKAVVFDRASTTNLLCPIRSELVGRAMPFLRNGCLVASCFLDPIEVIPHARDDGP